MDAQTFDELKHRLDQQRQASAESSPSLEAYDPDAVPCRSTPLTTVPKIQNTEYASLVFESWKWHRGIASHLVHLTFVKYKDQKDETTEPLWIAQLLFATSNIQKYVYRDLDLQSFVRDPRELDDRTFFYMLQGPAGYASRPSRCDCQIARFWLASPYRPRKRMSCPNSNYRNSHETISTVSVL